MSRRRKLERTRIEELDERLESLYRQGADEGFLDLAHERAKDLAECGAARLYGEVADRALRQALACGDLRHAERLLRRLRREIRACPLAVVVQVALSLWEGRYEEARGALATLDAAADGPPGSAAGAAGAGAAVPPPLLAALAALCSADPGSSMLAPRGRSPARRDQPSPAVSPQVCLYPEALDLARLRQAVAASVAQAGSAARRPLAPGGGLETAEARAVWSLYEELAAIGARGSMPAAAAVASLQRCLNALPTALASEPAVKSLLATAAQSARLLGEAITLERGMRHGSQRGRSAEISAHGRSLLHWAQRNHRSLVEALGVAPPAQASWLRPLHHALRRRWRALLQMVAEDEGAAAVWAELQASSPALFALELEAGGQGAAAAQRLRGWDQARRLVAAGEHGELARLLASAARGEEAPERLVLLWSLELSAHEREEVAALADEGPAILAGPTPRAGANLARLGQMAEQIAARLPPEQRADVARFLSERLLVLCEKLPFSRTTAAAAAALLRELPNEPALLLAALAGAVCSGDRRAEERLAAHIVTLGPARGAGKEGVLRLLPEVAVEAVDDAVRILRSIRPLLPEAEWPQALGLVVREILAFVGAAVRWGCSGLDLEDLRHDLRLFRGVLSECVEFAAVEAAVDCLDPAAGGERVLRKFLARTPGLEPALVVFELLTKAYGGGAPVFEELNASRSVVLDRLDSRWQLWLPLLSLLLLGASRQQIRRLRQRVVELERRKDLAEVDREALVGALRTIAILPRVERSMRRDLERSWAPPLVWPADEGTRREGGPARTRTKPRPRRKDGGGGQLDLDLG
jgi:hypothetical protein